jgi:hypothetical protein
MSLHEQHLSFVGDLDSERVEFETEQVEDDMIWESSNIPTDPPELSSTDSVDTADGKLRAGGNLSPSTSALPPSPSSMEDDLTTIMEQSRQIGREHLKYQEQNVQVS